MAWKRKLSNEKTGDGGSTQIKQWIRTNYRIGLLLLGIFLVAFLVRSYFAFNYVYSETPPKVAGNDPYYHKRAIDYILQSHHHLVEDDMLNYPVGGGNANPPLFEWGAVLLGYLVSPAFGSVEDAVNFIYPLYPIIWSALLVFPMYAIGRAMFNRKVGLLAALFIALTPAQIERISLGFADHDSMVLFFISITFYFLLMSLKYLEIKNWVRSWSSINDIIVGVSHWYNGNRIAIGYAILAGLSLAGIGLIWKGLAYVFTIIFLYFMFELLVNKFRNVDSMGVTLVVFITLVTSMLVMLPYYYSTGRLSYLDAPIVFMIGMVLFATVFVPTRDRPWITVIPTFFIVIGSGLVVLYLAFPDLWYTLSTGMGYFIKSKLVSTIAEAQPGDFSRMSFAFGMLNYFMALIGFGFLAYRVSKDLRTDAVFLLIWSVVMIFMALSTVRFMHDSSTIFALLSAFMIYYVIEKLDPEWRFLYLAAIALVIILSAWGYAINELTDYDMFMYIISGGFAIIAVGYIAYFVYELRILNRKDLRLRNLFGAIFFAFFLIIPNVWFAVDAGIPYEVKKDLDPQGKILGTYGSSFPSDYWVACFDWLSKQDNDLPMEERPAFISWWDYGFWCVYMGKHPTVADNFQWGYQFAGSYIVAQSEEDAVALSIVRVIEKDFSRRDVKEVLISYVGKDNYTNLRDIMAIESAVESKQEALIKEVMAHPEKYGPYHDLKIKNAKYATARYFFTSRFDLDTLVNIYKDLSEVTGYSIRYFAIDYRLFPFSAQNTGIFYAPVKLSDHTVSDYLEYLAYGEINYGTKEDPDWQPVGKPLTQEEVEKYAEDYKGFFRITGYKLRYKQEFFNTMLYRCYIGYDGGDLGMFDSEGYPDQGIPGLGDNDDETKADQYPPMQGWMMRHYRLVYKTTYWNPHNQSELDRNSKWYKPEYEDEWVAMNYDEAIEKRNKVGGVISSGLRAGVCMLKYYHGAILEGRVVTETGQGVPGVRVTVLDEYGIPHDTVFTEKDGSYRLVLPFGKVSIITSYGGFDEGDNGIYQKLSQREKNVLNTTNLEISDEQAMRKGSENNWRIKRDIVVKGAKIAGRVYWDFNTNGEFDEDSDEAIPNTEIKLVSESQPENLTYTVTSDIDGKYQFEDIVPGRYTLMCYVRGHLVETTGGSFDVQPGDNQTDNDLPVKSATAILHVKGEDGRNLSNIEFMLHDMGANETNKSIIYYNTTDENGTVIFKKIVAGNYIIELNDSGFMPFKVDHHFKEGEKYETNITLVPVSAIEGIVWYDANLNGVYDGKVEVLANARLTFINTKNNKTYIVFSDSNGHYIAYLPIGNYTENIFYTYNIYGHWDTERRSYGYIGSLSMSDMFINDDNGDYRTIYNTTKGFTLNITKRGNVNTEFKNAYRINGTVYNKNKNRINNVLIRFIPKSDIYGDEITPVVDVPVNKDGMYLAYLPAGMYSVYIKPQFLSAINNGSLLTEIEITSNMEYAFTIDQIVKIKGHVFWDLNGDGKYTPIGTETGNKTIYEGLDNITVVFKTDGAEMFVETSASGNYEIDLPPGTYRVVAYDAYKHRFIQATVDTFEVSAEKDVWMLNISMKPKLVTFRLKVYHDWNSNGIYDRGYEKEVGEKGVLVNITALEIGRTGTTAVVDSKGTAVANLIPGNYRISIDYSADDRYYYRATKNVSIPFGISIFEDDILTDVSVPVIINLASNGINVSKYIQNLTLENNNHGTEDKYANTIRIEFHKNDDVFMPIFDVQNNVTFITNMTPGEYTAYIKLNIKDSGRVYVYVTLLDLEERIVINAHLRRAVEVIGSFIYYENGQELTYYGHETQIKYESTEGWIINHNYNGSVYKVYLPNGTYIVHMNVTTDDGKYRYALPPNSGDVVIGDDGDWHPNVKLTVIRWRNVSGLVEFKDEAMANVTIIFENIDNRKVYNTQSNESGRYSIFMPMGIYRIKISNYGFLEEPKNKKIFNLTKPSEDFDLELVGGNVDLTIHFNVISEGLLLPTDVKLTLVPLIGNELKYDETITLLSTDGEVKTSIEPGDYVYEVKFKTKGQWYGSIGTVEMEVAKNKIMTINITNSSEVMFTVIYRDIDENIRYDAYGSLEISLGDNKVKIVDYINGGTSVILPYGEYKVYTEYETIDKGIELKYTYNKNHMINDTTTAILLELNRAKEYNVEVTYDGPQEFFVNPDDILEFKVKVKNMGNTKDTIEMSSVNPDIVMGEKWDVSFDPKEVTLRVGEESFVNVTVKVPSKLKPEGTLSVKATSKGSRSVYDSIEFKIHAPIFKEFSMRVVNRSDRGVIAGKSVEYYINIENNGNADEDFNITYSGLPSDWNITGKIDDNEINIGNYSVTIGPYENKTLTIILTAPNKTVMMHDTATVKITVTAYNSKKNVQLTARVDTPDLKVVEITFKNKDLKEGDMVQIAPVIRCDNVDLTDGFYVLLYIDNRMIENQTHDPINESELATVIFEVNASAEDLVGDYHSIKIEVRPKGMDKNPLNNELTRSIYIGPAKKLKTEEFPWPLVALGIILLAILALAVYWWKKREIL